MKKRIVIMICFSLLLFCLMTCTVEANGIVSSNNEDNSIEFNNFTYSSTKIRTNCQQKVKITCTFDTNEPIRISKIHYEIESQNGTVENFDKQPGKEQSCSFVVEDWQIGTLKLDITYELCDEDGYPTFDGEYVKEFYLAANSKWKEEINWPSAILLGFFTMVCVISATSIVISSSKEEKIIKELDEEE